MTGVTIKSVALEMQVSVDFLIKEFACVGIIKSKEDYITLKEKKIILNKINCLKKNSENQLVLQRKTRSTLNISSIGGKNKKVCVEVRKNCTYIKSTLNYSNMGNLEKKGKNLLEFSLLPSLNKSLNDLVQNNLSEKKRIKIDNYKMLSTELFNDSICHNKALEEKKCISSGESHKFNKSKVINVVEKNKNLNIKSNFLGSICERKGNKNSIRMKSADNERRSRVRLKFRNEKFSRQKKNYNRQLYDMSTNIDKEEFSKFPRFDRNKRKSSVLVQNFNRPTQISARDVILGKTITVAELSNKMSIKSSQVIKVMMNLGFIATINQILDQDTAQLVAEEMGKNVILRKDNEIEKQIMRDRDVGDQLQAKIRAPIVTVMGHVDHGKTSLLDYIRSTTIVSSEHGGITQKIGAYHVKTDRGMITFIDTPGHEAFISMRDRGIQITDIVVLVVAADDGVMCQTVESIKKIQSAKIPLIVAINKIDKVGADPERVKHELSKYGVISDSWGGEVQFVEVSATVGTGINNLLDAILLQSEFLELKTVYDGMANATVIESFLDKRRGPIITALVHSGTLKCGDIVLCGKEYGRIRAMRDEFGRKIISAGPSIPTEILGLSGMPISGEAVIVVRNERKAREVAMYRKNKFRENKLFNKNKISVENAFSKVKFSILELNLIIKSDSQGSSEAIFESLKKLSVDQIKINILHNSVGFINETDILLAIASNAIILGFNVRTDISTRRLIELECVNIIHYYSIIYDLLNGVKKIIDSLVTPKYEKKIVGLAKVCNVFSLPKYGKVAGCIVTEGSIKRKNKICILREKKIVYEGELESLRRFKDDVNEVQYGIEFGITVKNYNNILLEDIIESFDILGV